MRRRVATRWSQYWLGAESHSASPHNLAVSKLPFPTRVSILARRKTQGEQVIRSNPTAAPAAAPYAAPAAACLPVRQGLWTPRDAAPKKDQ